MIEDSIETFRGNWNDVILVQFRLDEGTEIDDGTSQALKDKIKEFSGRDIPVVICYGGNLEVITKSNQENLKRRVDELERIVAELADSHGLAYNV